MLENCSTLSWNAEVYSTISHSFGPPFYLMSELGDQPKQNGYNSYLYAKFDIDSYINLPHCEFYTNA